jgi:hypothetical protein
MAEEMLAVRGLIVGHETVRRWTLKFGRAFADRIRRLLPQAGDKWRLDEVAIKIAGVKHRLWRAVAACCMGRQIGRVEPYPHSGSRDPDILRAPKVQHAVQHVGGDGHFGRPSPVCLRAQFITDDALPSRCVGLHQSAPVVA